MIEQTAPEQLSGQAVHYELDLSQPADPQRSGAQRSRPARGLGLVAALAFAVGLALGAAGFVQRQSAATTAAQRAELLLVAALETSNARHAYVVRVHNAGPLPLQVSQARLIAPGYEDPTEPGTASHDVQPGTWSRMIARTGEPVCPPPAALSGGARFMALVTTADGRALTVDLPVLDDHATLDSFRYSECATILNPEQAVQLWIEPDAATDPPTGRGQLQITSWAWDPVEVTSIEHAPGLEIQLASELPISIPEQSTVPVDIEINVTECGLVPDGDAAGVLHVTTRFQNQTFRHEMWISSVERIRVAACE